MNWAYLLLFSFAVTGCVSSNRNNATLTAIPKASDEGCYAEDYQDPSNSQYILPYEVGKSFVISNGNCGRYNTHRPHCTGINKAGLKINCGDLRYAYDFAIPIGINIVAARGGIVIETDERFSNSNNGVKEENVIVIEHSDGTVAFYLHLSPRGVLVEVGEIVAQGDVIGIAGSSGYTGNNPHLHFHVVSPSLNNCGDKEYSGCKTVPVTFKNAKPLVAPLIEWSSYEALSY